MDASAELEEGRIDEEKLQRLNSKVLADGQAYSVLTKKEKTCITTILAFFGLCSSIGVSIYWVCLTEMRLDFGITEEQINLTVTVYLVFQAISPAVVANYSDQLGRRPVLLLCAAGGLAVNIGIAECNVYWLLMLLRCLQAIFVAPMYSLGTAVCGDLVSGRDRGSMTAILGGMGLMGQALAPFIGSLVDTRWNWRAIFWLVAIFDGFVLLVSLFILPETNRSFVGNMSHTPDRWVNRAPILALYKSRLTDTSGSTVEERKRFKKNPFEAFHIVKNYEVIPILLPTSLIYAACTMSQISLTTALSVDYNFTTLKIGLCFFGPGFMTVTGTLLSGVIMDKLYVRSKARYAKTDLSEPFNVIRPRLKPALVTMSLSAAVLICYGWVIKYHEPAAAVVVLGSLVCLCVTYPLASSMTLMVDLYPHETGSAASMVNFLRCGLGAIMVSVLSRMNLAMTIGGTYSLMGALCFLGAVVNGLVIYKSPAIMHHRQKRLQS